MGGGGGGVRWVEKGVFRKKSVIKIYDPFVDRICWKIINPRFQGNKPITTSTTRQRQTTPSSNAEIFMSRT